MLGFIATVGISHFVENAFVGLHQRLKIMLVGKQIVSSLQWPANVCRASIISRRTRGKYHSPLDVFRDYMENLSRFTASLHS